MDLDDVAYNWWRSYLWSRCLQLTLELLQLFLGFIKFTHNTLTVLAFMFKITAVHVSLHTKINVVLYSCQVYNWSHLSSCTCKIAISYILFYKTPRRRNLRLIIQILIFYIFKYATDTKRSPVKHEVYLKEWKCSTFALLKSFRSNQDLHQQLHYYLQSRLARTDISFILHNRKLILYKPAWYMA